VKDEGTVHLLTQTLQLAALRVSPSGSRRAYLVERDCKPSVFSHEPVKILRQIFPEKMWKAKEYERFSIYCLQIVNGYGTTVKPYGICVRANLHEAVQ